jgi:hypothetical protein
MQFCCDVMCFSIISPRLMLFLSFSYPSQHPFFLIPCPSQHLRMAPTFFKKIWHWISSKSKEPPTECTVCTSSVTNLPNLVLDCGHVWCLTCVIFVFTRAAETEACFPPRCCQPISLSAARHLLPLEVILAFTRARREYMTINRIYCHVESCSAFIPRSKIFLRRARCEDCGANT